MSPCYFQNRNPKLVYLIAPTPLKRNIPDSINFNCRSETAGTSCNELMNSRASSVKASGEM